PDGAQSHQYLARPRLRVRHVFQLHHFGTAELMDANRFQGLLISTRRILWDDFDIQLLGPPQYRQFALQTYLVARQHPMQVINRRHCPAIESDDHVAFFDPRSGGRTTWLHGDHQYPTLARQLMESHEPTMQIDVLSGDANIRATDLAVAHQVSEHKPRRVNGHGKTDTLGGQDHGRIHTNDLTARVDQWPARVARI